MSSISLNKENAGRGNGARLVEDDGSAQRRLRFGAKWTATVRGRSGVMGFLSKKGGLDIDLIAILMEGSKPTEYVGLDSLDPLRAAGSPIRHSGDSLTGEDNKKRIKNLKPEEIELLDDEEIDVELDRMPLEFTSIFFTASVFKKGGMADAARDQGFQGARGVEFSMYNLSGPAPVKDARIKPDLGASQNCCLIAKVSRTSLTDPAAPWQIEVLEEMVDITRGSMQSLLEHCRSRV